MYQKTWSGDWHARVLERAQRLGFATVTQYAAARVGVSLVDLAEELASANEDVAGVQVMWILVEEAIRTNTVPRVLRDLFVRELRQALPQGWKFPLDDASRCDVAGAVAGWKVELKEHLDDKATSMAGRELLNAELPDGWLPAGPDDPVIVSFVERCRGRAPS